MHGTSNCGYCVDHTDRGGSFVRPLSQASFWECGAAVKQKGEKLHFPSVFFTPPPPTPNAKVLSRMAGPRRLCHILHVRVWCQLSIKLQKNGHVNCPHKVLTWAKGPLTQGSVFVLLEKMQSSIIQPSRERQWHVIDWLSLPPPFSTEGMWQEMFSTVINTQPAVRPGEYCRPQKWLSSEVLPFKGFQLPLSELPCQAPLYFCLGLKHPAAENNRS